MSDLQRAAVVYNPTKVNATRLRSAIDFAATRAGWGETRWYATTTHDAGQLLAGIAAHDGAALVVAAGGDGTVRAVAEGLRDTGVPMALIPAGTGNLLARNIGIPLSSIDEAARIAFEGATRRIDIGLARISRDSGEVDEHVFLVMAGMGIDAAMIANTNPALKKAVGWLAYVDAGMRSLPKSRPFHVRYRLEGRPEHSAHLSTILFGNCGTLTAGLELMPDALIDDGLLDIAVLQPKGLLGWLQVWNKVRWENSVLRRWSIGRKIIRLTNSRRAATVTYLRTSSASIRLDDEQQIELDGDAFGSTREARFIVQPGALDVRVRPAA
ncbi:diacylglycerol kinase family protein [Okibacterium endophyticum]